MRNSEIKQLDMAESLFDMLNLKTSVSLLFGTLGCNISPCLKFYLINQFNLISITVLVINIIKEIRTKK